MIYCSVDLCAWSSSSSPTVARLSMHIYIHQASAEIAPLNPPPQHTKQTHAPLKHPFTPPFKHTTQTNPFQRPLRGGDLRVLRALRRQVRLGLGRPDAQDLGLCPARGGGQPRGPHLVRFVPCHVKCAAALPAAALLLAPAQNHQHLFCSSRLCVCYTLKPEQCIHRYI